MKAIVFIFTPQPQLLNTIIVNVVVTVAIMQQETKYMELKNLKRTVKKFGDLGKFTVMLPELAQFANKEITFDVINIKETTK